MKTGHCVLLFLGMLTPLSLIGQSPPSETSGGNASKTSQQTSPEPGRGQISGRVYRADTAEPVRGLTVFAVRLEFERDGSRNLLAYAKSITDDHGGFRFDKLRGGPYFLRTGGLSQHNPRSEPELQGTNQKVYYGESYYPENALSENAEPIAVKLGTEVHGIQIPVRPEQTYTIRGKVEGAATSVFAERIKEQHLFGFPQARPLADRSFAFGDTAPGDYVITAIAVHEGRGIPPTVVRGYAKVTVTNADTWVNVRLGEAARVRGTAKIEGPSRLTLRDLQIGLSNPLQGHGQTTSPIDPSGRFDIGGLSPGAHDFDVFYPEDPRDETLYVKWAECSGKEYTSHPLILDVGTVVENCSVVVAQDKVTIHGKVLSGANPGRWLRVVLVPSTRELRRKLEFTRDSITGSDGDFEIREVIPGDYLIFAVVDSVDRKYLAPDFPDHHAGEVKHIHVNQTATEPVVLDVVKQD